MSQALTAAQHEELKGLLLARQKELRSQMEQNRANTAPPDADQDGLVRSNARREVDQVLTNIDAADLERIGQALKKMDDGSYGLCGECGCDIPFERLKAEPQTQHCVPCKSRWEVAQAKAH